MNRHELPRSEQEQILRDGSYHPMIDLSPVRYVDGRLQFDEGIKSRVKIGDKVELVTNFGNRFFYTITHYLCPARDGDLVGRMEGGDPPDHWGIHKGQEYCIDSSMFKEYDIGWRILDGFPWERLPVPVSKDESNFCPP